MSGYGDGEDDSQNGSDSRDHENNDSEEVEGEDDEDDETTYSDEDEKYEEEYEYEEEMYGDTGLNGSIVIQKSHVAVYEINARWGSRLMMFLITLGGILCALNGGLCAEYHCKDLQLCPDGYQAHGDWCGPSGTLFHYLLVLSFVIFCLLSLLIFFLFGLLTTIRRGRRTVHADGRVVDVYVWIICYDPPAIAYFSPRRIHTVVSTSFSSGNTCYAQTLLSKYT